MVGSISTSLETTVFSLNQISSVILWKILFQVLMLFNEVSVFKSNIILKKKILQSYVTFPHNLSIHIEYLC